MCSGEDRVWSKFFFFSIGYRDDDYLYEATLWNYDRTHTRALDEERAREKSDVKKVLVKFSDAHD